MALNSKPLKIATVGAVALGVACLAADAQAQTEKVTANVNATVDNSFTLVETTVMNFGTIVAKADTVGNTTATLTISTAGALTPVPTGPAASRFVIFNAANATQGVFDVTNAAPSTKVTISFANPVALSCALCSGNEPDITIGTFVHDAGANPATDVNGALNFNVGATLTTAVGPVANQYEDGAYAGTYDVLVAY